MPCLSALFLHFWLYVTDDVTGILLGHKRFSSITSDRIEICRVENSAIVGALSSRIDWDATWSPSQSMVWRGVTWPWPRSQRGLWLLPNKKYIICRGLMRWLQWCLNFSSTITWRSYESKTKPRPFCHWCDLRAHRLTWDLKFGYQSLCLVMADMIFFRDPVAQLGPSHGTSWKVQALYCTFPRYMLKFNICRRHIFWSSPGINFTRRGQQCQSVWLVVGRSIDATVTSCSTVFGRTRMLWEVLSRRQFWSSRKMCLRRKV